MNSHTAFEHRERWGEETEPTPQDSIIATEDYKLAGTMEAILQNCASNNQKVHTIHKVPPSVRNRYKEDYDPKIISIGPFHREKEQLKPMEELKWRYLEEILERCSDKSLLAKYISKVRQLEERARKSYSETLDALDSDSFIQMMVLDGCFIIQLLTKSYTKDESLHQLKSVNWNLPHVRNDLLLLENQIPFFVLQSLFNLSSFLHVYEHDRVTLVSMAFYFINRHSYPGSTTTPVHILPTAPVHLLHLFQSSLYGGYRKEVSKSTFNRARAPRMFPNVTKLRESGVKFKKTKTNQISSLRDIYFKDGVLEIPRLTIQEETPSLFRNLISFEQCCPQYGSHFTSYAVFLNNLIDKPEDVAVLKRCDILESKLGKDEDVAELFNELCRGAYLNFEDHDLADLFAQVKDYSEVYLHRWRAKLMHDYFSNPWTTTSVVAAIFLLILTTVQTFYAVYAYHSPPK